MDFGWRLAHQLVKEKQKKQQRMLETAKCISDGTGRTGNLNKDTISKWQKKAQ